MDRSRPGAAGQRYGLMVPLAQAMLVFVQDPLDDNRYKPLCNIVGYEPCQWNPQHPTNARNTPEGYIPPPEPTACGPNTPCSP